MLGQLAETTALLWFPPSHPSSSQHRTMGVIMAGTTSIAASKAHCRLQFHAITRSICTVGYGRVHNCGSFDRPRLRGFLPSLLPSAAQPRYLSGEQHDVTERNDHAGECSLMHLQTKYKPNLSRLATRIRTRKDSKCLLGKYLRPYFSLILPHQSASPLSHMPSRS